MSVKLFNLVEQDNRKNMKEVEVVYAANGAEWREWLEKNHASKEAVWVVFYTKASRKVTMQWTEAVDEALCFGWIDSKKVAIDHEKSHQFFSRRKPGSTWSRINKEKIVRLIESGKMTDAGLKSIEIAKQNGSWTILDSVEDLLVPEDLEAAFALRPGSAEFFSSLSKSVKKMMLYWLVSAKKPETRQKRIEELADHAARQTKPKGF